MKTRKTIWIMILAAVLLLALPLSALSEEPEEPDDPEVETGDFGGGTWSFNEGELIIDGAADLDNFWPENELDFYRDITWVTFGPEVTNIRADAFACCPVDGFAVSEDNPNYITVEGILYSKDETQLLGVPAAKTGTLDIPSKVTGVDYLAFSHCSISAISVDPGNANYSSQDGVLFNKSMTELICYPAGKEGSQYTLPGSVGWIDVYAFSNVKNLREITLHDSQSQNPANELVIDSNAFIESSLETVHFPSTLKRIENSAFEYCDSLTNLTYEGYASEWAAVEIGRHNTPLYLYPVICQADNNEVNPRPEEGQIGENVFFTLNYQTGQLTVSGAGTWYEGAFTYTDAIRSVTLDNSVTEIGAYAFLGCDHLEEANIGSSVTRIGTGSFNGCTGLRNISIPDGVTEIDDYAFDGCRNLRTVSINNNKNSSELALIGEQCFYGCYRLPEINIPASVGAIGGEAFGECYSLTDIHYGSTQADWETLMDSREDEWTSWVTVHCSDGDKQAANPLLIIEPVEFLEEGGCPNSIRLGELLTIRVQPQEDVDCYDATLSKGDTVLTAWGSSNGVISFSTWPDDAEAGIYTLRVIPYSEYITDGREAEATITVTDYDRPAAPDVQIRILNQQGEEPDVIYANSGYDMEISWNVDNVQEVRFKNCSEEIENTGTLIVDAREYQGENRYGLLTEMVTHEAGTEYIYVSVCINGVWSLWSEPLVLYPAEKPSLEKPAITMIGKDEEPYEYSLGEDVVFSVTLDPNTEYIDYYVWSSDDEEVYSEFDVRTNGNQQMEFTIDSDLLDGDTYTIRVKCFNGNDEYFGPSSNVEWFTVTGYRPDGPVVEMDSTEAQFGDVLYATIYTDGAEEIIVESPPYGEQNTWLTGAGQATMILPVKVEFYDSAELHVRTRKNQTLSAWTVVEIQAESSPMAINWDDPCPIGVVFPDITAGKNISLAIPEVYGARWYSINVYDDSYNQLYWQSMQQPGTAVIPAVIFADGGDFNVQVSASDGYNTIYEQHVYENVPKYTASRKLTAAAPYTNNWPYGKTAAFTLTPGSGVSGRITTVFIQREIGSGWAMDGVIEDNNNRKQVWVTPSRPGPQTYRFAACIGGKWTDWSKAVTVTVGESLGTLDATDPVVPATIGLGEDLTVSWSAVNLAQRYDVHLFSLDGDAYYIHEAAGITSYTFDKSYLPAGSYGVRIEACADGYDSNIGRARMVRVVPGALTLSIENSGNYPAGLPVVVGGFRPVSSSEQESFDVVLEQNGAEPDSYTYELDEVDDQGRIILVPFGLEAGEYTIRATRHIPGVGDSEEATCTLTVTGERPTVGELTVSGAEFYIPHGVDFRFSGDRYGQEAYCMITETPDGQQAETLTENVDLWWMSDSGCIWSDYQYDPMQREYQFRLCCSDGRWTAWTDPVTVTWLSKGQAAAPALTGLEGSELLAGESLVLRGITLEENDGLPDYYVIALDRSAGDNAWEYVSSCSFSRGDLNPDGSYTAELFGLDAEEDGSAQEYRLVVQHCRSGYVNSEKTEYHFTVTGTRPSVAEYVFPAGTIQLNAEAYAEISAEGITGACAASPYSRSGEVYLPEGDTVYIPLDTSWADTREYLFRARIGTQWTAPVEHEVTVSGTVRILAKPKVTVPKTFYISRPMEVTIKPVANAQYYTVSVNRLNAEGEVSEGIYYDLVLDLDANGKALLPTLDFVDPGKYVFAFSACADGYDPGTTGNYISTGSFAADAPPAPITECLTAAPAPRQNVDFRITTDPEADQISLLVYLEYEEYGCRDLLLNESLVPAGGTADYTLNYWLVGKGVYRVRASQRVNGEWSAYSTCDFTVSGEAAEQLPPVTITSFPEEIISGEPFTVSWEAAEGAASYVAEWRFNHDDVWKEVELTGATSASMTIDPAAEGMDYYCHVRISAYAPGKVGSTAEREAEILDSRGPTLAASRNQAAPDDEVILTAGNVYGDRLRVSVDNGKPELVYSRPMDGKQTFSLRLGAPGEHTIRVSCGVSEKYSPYRPGCWSRWSDAVTVTVIDDTGLTPHTVTFNANGGRGRMENQTVYEETQLPLAANAYTRTGMYFDGWNTKANGRGTAYADGQAVSLTEDTILYAQWETKTIWFSVDVIDRTSGAHMIGGKVRLSGSCVVDGTAEPIEDDGEDCDFSYSGDVSLTLEAIPSGNYSFAGWYSGDELNGELQTLMPLELLSTEPILNLELTEHGRENRTMICAVYEYAPAYRTAAFRVPENLTVIPESAFENIGAATVYVPDSCTEIKANAFKDCGQLRQIRLPKNCVIDDDANPFAGCRTDPDSLGWDDENERWEDCSDLLTIFAPAGGTTQAWAEEAGILFVAE